MKDIVERIKNTRALVLGDEIIDMYFFGEVHRVCPEAPVPVLVPSSIEQRSGGAANAGLQMRALECAVTGVFSTTPSVKTRFFAGNHLLLRVDQDHIETGHEDQVLEVLQSKILGERKIDVIVLSDYAKGFLTPRVCQFVIKFANENGIPTVVDPKGRDWSKYTGTSWICPNSKEWAERSGSVGDNVLLKRGAEGLQLIENDSPFALDFPAKAQVVFDVTGAGDTVVAVFAAALAAKATPQEAAQLANLAAGVVVGKVGTALCSKDELLALL